MGNSHQIVLPVQPAPGVEVTIEGLRFVNPHNAAIRVAQSGDLRIANCQVEGMTPSVVGGQNAALAVHLPGGPVGAVSILENRFQIGGTAADSVGGIIMTGPADRLLIADNRITGTTSHGMDLRDVNGPARVERNIIGSVGNTVPREQRSAIHAHRRHCGSWRGRQ